MTPMNADERTEKKLRKSAKSADRDPGHEGSADDADVPLRGTKAKVRYHVPSGHEGKGEISRTPSGHEGKGEISRTPCMLFVRKIYSSCTLYVVCKENI